MQTLMEMDCFPAGMELFPAMDEEQWGFIRSVIDDCDYYLLIIGGRYGSLTSEGISYTEKEFDYAIERGIRVIALLHESPDAIPVGKSDVDPSLREKLIAFRQKVTTGRLVKFWNHQRELPGLVSVSLLKTIKTYPAIGWVRTPKIFSEQLLIELENLRRENAELKGKLHSGEKQGYSPVTGLAGLDSVFVLTGKYGNTTTVWSQPVTWRQLFAATSPSLLERPPAYRWKREMADFVLTLGNVQKANPRVDDSVFDTVMIQFKALGLITVEHDNEGLYVSLTPAGEFAMLRDRSIKDRAE